LYFDCTKQKLFRQILQVRNQMLAHSSRLSVPPVLQYALHHIQKTTRRIGTPEKRTTHLHNTSHPACPSGTPHFAVLYHEAGTQKASQPLVRALVRLCRRVVVRHDSLVGVIVPAQGNTTGRAVQSFSIGISSVIQVTLCYHVSCALRWLEIR
jgi:hypothetical protein